MLSRALAAFGGVVRVARRSRVERGGVAPRGGRTVGHDRDHLPAARQILPAAFTVVGCERIRLGL